MPQDQEAEPLKIHYDGQPAFETVEGVSLFTTPKTRSVMSWHAVDHENGMRMTALRISSPYMPPNRWYRFWARVLLGVTWEVIDHGEPDEER